MQRIRLYFLGILAWGALWVLPWQDWMGGSIWLKLSISLIILIVPGAFLYRLLEKEGTEPINFLIFGFILSHMLLALMGTAGRLLHVSFLLITNVFMGLGTLLLMANTLIDLRRSGTSQPRHFNFQKVVVYLPLALAILLAALMTIQRVISEDDLAYLAYITHWQRMPALDFKDVYFGADQLTMTRMWLVSTPFSQAFLAERSGLHGILILTGYYEPLLAVLACLVLYQLARDLGFSRRAALFSVIAQVVFLALLSDYLHPGAPFFRQLSTDKATAAFIFAPAFIQSLVAFFRRPGVKSSLLSFLVGLSLSLMHPVIAAFTVLIGGGIALLSLTRDNFKQLFVYGILGVLILSPYIAIRFAVTAAQPQIPYDTLSIMQADGVENMITVWGQGPYYGFNLSVLEIPVSYLVGSLFVRAVIARGWIIIPIFAALLALGRFRRGYAPRYVLSSILLCILAGFPLTGWILGRFFSAWMLERSTWLFPYGIGFTYLLLAFRQSAFVTHLFDRMKWKAGRMSRLRFASLLLSVLWILSLLVIVRVMQIQKLPNFGRLMQTTQRYQQLVSVGQYMDTVFTEPEIVAASDDLNDFLPALSWKAKVLTYRPSDPYYPYFFSVSQRSESLIGRRAIFSNQISLDDRAALIFRFDVKLLVVQNTQYDLFKPMIKRYPTEFSVEHLGKYFLIYRN